jgi:hypothetical protein
MEQVENQKKTYVRTRCTAKTKEGLVCRRKQEADCSYCKQHGEMFRVRIPVYHVPSSAFVMLDELKPCPQCNSNITYGEPCIPCTSYIAY